MKEDIECLSDRERETLRLLGKGHDAKSIASALRLSVHTVTERLRSARRKLGVSSSREAARLLLAHEEGVPKNVGHKIIGVAGAPASRSLSTPAHLGATGAERRLLVIAIGVIMLVVLMSALITAHAGGNNPTASYPRLAEPSIPLPSLFVAADYPADAIAKHAQGNVDFRLQIGDSGRVEKCEIDRSSGNAALDEATCQVIVRRARFRAAINAAGRPSSSIYASTIRWIL